MSKKDKDQPWLSQKAENELETLSTDCLVEIVANHAEDVKALLIDELIRRDLSVELGTDPKTQRPVFVKIAQYGAVVQLGTIDDEEKPRFAPLRKNQKIGTITLEDALALLILPRILGEEKGKKIKANEGRFGPYLQVGTEIFSMKNTETDPYTITLQEAKEIIATKREEVAKKTIRLFEGSVIKILRGPYGPYITNGKKIVSLPKKEKKAEDYTLAECKEILRKVKPTRKKSTKKAPNKRTPQKLNKTQAGAKKRKTLKQVKTASVTTFSQEEQEYNPF